MYLYDNLKLQQRILMKYHVDGFDVDSITAFLAVLYFILLAIICAPKCVDCTMDFDEEESLPLARANRVYRIGEGGDMRCPSCGEYLTMDMSSDAEP